MHYQVVKQVVNRDGTFFSQSWDTESEMQAKWRYFDILRGAADDSNAASYKSVTSLMLTETGDQMRRECVEYAEPTTEGA